MHKCQECNFLTGLHTGSKARFQDRDEQNYSNLHGPCTIPAEKGEDAQTGACSRYPIRYGPNEATTELPTEECRASSTHGQKMKKMKICKDYSVEVTTSPQSDSSQAPMYSHPNKLTPCRNAGVRPCIS